MYIKLLLILLMFSTTSYASPEDESGKLNKYLDKHLSSCTPEQAHICDKLKKFRNGTKPDLDSNGYYIGEQHSGDIMFLRTLDYRKRFMLVYVRIENTKISASVSNLVADNDSEVKGIKAFLNNPRKVKNNTPSDLEKFLSQNEAQQEYASCEVNETQASCIFSPSDFGAVNIRSNNGSLYLFSIARVPKMAGSWDTVPGFYIAELVSGN